jgi:hypothetical protein
MIAIPVCREPCTVTGIYSHIPDMKCVGMIYADVVAGLRRLSQICDKDLDRTFI